MYQNIAIVLLGLAIALFFFLDSIIDKNTSDKTMQSIYTNNKVIAGACVVGAYFAYTQSLKAKGLVLPTYSDFNTEDALNA